MKVKFNVAPVSQVFVSGKEAKNRQELTWGGMVVEVEVDIEEIMQFHSNAARIGTAIRSWVKDEMPGVVVTTAKAFAEAKAIVKPTAEKQID